MIERDSLDHRIVAAALELYVLENGRRGWMNWPDLSRRARRMRREHLEVADAIDRGDFVGGSPPDAESAVWVSTVVAAERLGVSPRRVLQLAEGGRLGRSQPPTDWKIDGEAVDELVRMRQP